jgi:hypothetical protein
MRPELRKEILRILEELSGFGVKGFSRSIGIGADLTREAIKLLCGNGAINEIQASRYIITDMGYDYYDKVKNPKFHWIKKNWFRIFAVLLPVAAVLVVGLMNLACQDQP